MDAPGCSSWLDDAPLPPPDSLLIPSTSAFTPPWSGDHFTIEQSNNFWNLLPPLGYGTQENDSERIAVVHVIPEEREYIDRAFYYGDEWVEGFFYEMDALTPHDYFKSSNNRFHIDGLVKNQSTDGQTRFSLGCFVSAVPVIQMIKMIGSGVEIWRDQKGNVFLKNTSKVTVFVQAANYACRAGDPLDTVYRLASPYKEPSNNTHTVVLFDMDKFQRLFKKCRRVDELTALATHCNSRISFIKGFGKNYPLRPVISKCPVWVELKFCVPLMDIDKKFEKLWAPYYEKPPRR